MKRSTWASGSGIGAFRLDRVLGGHDEERVGQRMGLAADRDLALLHGLEQRALHLGRRPVDLVGQHQVGEDRPERDLELAELLVVDPGADDVGRHQVGGELDALEVDADRVGHGLDGQRLGQTGDALDEEVAAGEQGDDHALEQHVLADDDPLDLVEHLLERGVRARRSSRVPGRSLAGAPAAPPAVPIGTAKPMPMKSSSPEGLARPVTMPIT